MQLLSDRQPERGHVVVLALQPPGYRHRELLGDAALHVLVVAAAVHRRGGRGAGEDRGRGAPDAVGGEDR